MNRILIGLIGRRIAVTALTLLIVSAIIFTITNLLPGDAAQAALGQSATPETVAALRQQFGLDMPAHVRYVHWLTGLLHGDFGRSLSGDMPVSELIGGRLPKSLTLAAITTAVSVPIALLLGILAAVKRESVIDRVISLGTLSLVATPEFLIATVAVLVFAVKLRWLSALSYSGPIEGLHDFLRAYAMPVLTLCAVVIAQMAHDARRGDRAAERVVCRDGHVEGRERTRRAAPCAAERDRPDRQCDRAEPVVSARRRDRRRDDLQLSGPREPDGRRRQQPRFPVGPGVHADLLRRVPDARAVRRPVLDRVEPAIAHLSVSSSFRDAAHATDRTRTTQQRAAALRRPARGAGSVPPAACARPAAQAPVRIALTAGGRVGLSMAGLMLFVAVFAPLIAPHDVGTIVTPDVFAPFSAKLPFGSDFLGRDMLSRILYGTRLTVLLALAAVLLAAVTGTTLGCSRPCPAARWTRR